MSSALRPARTSAPARWVSGGCALAEDRGSAAAEAALGALAAAPSEPALLVAFAAGAQGLGAIGAGLAAAAPRVPVVGCATPVTLPGLPERSTGVTIAALGGAGLTVSTAAVGGARGLREAGAEAAACLGDVADRPFQALLLFADVRAGDPQDVVRGAYSVAGAGVPLVGGGALAGPPALLHGDEADPGVVVVAAAIGSEAPLGVGVRHGLRPAGEPLLVTRTDGLHLLELDGRPALDAYVERLGCAGDDRDTLLELARAHPLGMSRRAGEEQLRTVIDIDVERRSLTVLGQLPEGGLAWPMSADRAATDAAAAAACADAVAALGGAAPSALLLLDPLARENAAASPDRSGDAPAAGGAVIGQIARQRGLVGFHNQAYAVLALA
jgi:hypothetical protein